MWPPLSGFIFVSYSRRDIAYVDGLVKHLSQAGLTVWLDTERIDYGDRWEHVIRDQVDACAAMVVVMSPAAEASLHVGNELQRARQRDKAILPVLLSGNGFFALGTSHSFDARRGELPDARFLTRLADVSANSRPEGLSSDSTRAPGLRGQLVVGEPPGQAVAWQERPDLLDALVATGGTAGATVVAALAGQRGVGKTQLAAAYARLRIQHGWPVIVWASAETEAGLIAGLDELAAAAEIRNPQADPRTAARAALHWLRTLPGPCLLVYDNAVDADIIRAWTPSIGSVHTVVTTTHRELDSLGQLIDVTLFTPDEAAAYLRRRTGLDDPAGASELAEQLGRLPLALAQAGAVVGTGRRYRNYRRYVQALDRVPTGKLLPRTPGDPYPHGLAEAILLSLDDLAHADAGGHARWLLDDLAVLAPTGADGALLHRLVNAHQAALAEHHQQRLDVGKLTGAPSDLTPTGDAHADIYRQIQRLVRQRARQIGADDISLNRGVTAQQ